MSGSGSTRRGYRLWIVQLVVISPARRLQRLLISRFARLAGGKITPPTTPPNSRTKVRLGLPVFASSLFLLLGGLSAYSGGLGQSEDRLAGAVSGDLLLVGQGGQDGAAFSLLGVLLHLHLVLGAADQAAGTLDTAALAGHTLDEVAVKDTLLHLQQGDLTGGDAVAGDSLQLEGILQTLLLDDLGHSSGDTAAVSEVAGVGAGLIQLGGLQSGEVNVFGLEQREQLLVGQDTVHGAHGAAQLELLLLGDTGPDEDDLGVRLLLLDVQAQHDHGGGGAGNQVLQIGVLLLDVTHEAGAAGGDQHTLLNQLLGLVIGNHIGAHGDLSHTVEAQLLQTGDDLTEGGRGELTGDGGGDDGIGLIAPVLGAHDHVDGVGDVGLVLDGAEGALVDAAAAGNALAGIDGGLLVGTHGNGLGGAALLTGALGLDDGAVLAGADAAAAGHALVVVDLSAVVDDLDGILGAGVDAAGGQTAAAGGTHGDLGDGALVAGDGQNLYDTGVAPGTAHSHLHTAVDDGALLINTAT